MPDDRFLHRRAGHSQKVNLLTDLEFRAWTQYLLSADDFGVMRGTHHQLQADNDHLANRPARIIQRCLDALVKAGLIRTFTHQGKPYVYQHDWQRWQKVSYPRGTNLPAPPADALEQCDEATRKLFAMHPGGAGRKRDGSENVPETVQERSPLTRAGAPAERLTANGLGERLPAKANGPTLIQPYRQATNFAHLSGCGNVPHFLHAEFVGKVLNGGGDEQEARDQVEAFYKAVDAQYAGQVVGEDALKFWRARFAERSKPVQAASAAASMVFATLNMGGKP